MTRDEVRSVPRIQAPPKSMKNRSKATQDYKKGDLRGSSQQAPSLLSPSFPSPLTIKNWIEHTPSPQGISSFSEVEDSEVSLGTSFEVRDERRGERMDERDISPELERTLDGLRTDLYYIHKHFTKKEVARKAPHEMQLPLISVAEAVHKGLVAYLCSGERDVSQFPSDPDWIKSKYHDDIFLPMVELITALRMEVKGLAGRIEHSSSSSSEEGNRKEKLARGARYRGHANSDSSSSEGAAPSNMVSFPQRQPYSPLPLGHPGHLFGEDEGEEDRAKMRAEAEERRPGQEAIAQRKTMAETDKEHRSRAGSSDDFKTMQFTGGNTRIRPASKISTAPKTSIPGSSAATDRGLPSDSQQIESTQKSAQDPEWTGLEQLSGLAEVQEGSDKIQEGSLETGFRPESTPQSSLESSHDEELEENSSPPDSAGTNWFCGSTRSSHSDEAQTPRAGKRLADELEDAEASQQQQAGKDQRSFWRQLLEFGFYLQLLLFFGWETVREATSKRKSPARVVLPLAYSLWLLRLILRMIARQAMPKWNLPAVSLSRLTTGLMSLVRLVYLFVFGLLRPALLLLTMQIYIAVVRERSVWLQASGLTRPYLIGYAHTDPSRWFMPGVDLGFMSGVSELGALAILLLQTVDVWLGGIWCVQSGGGWHKLLSSTLHGS